MIFQQGTLHALPAMFFMKPERNFVDYLIPMFLFAAPFLWILGAFLIFTHSTQIQQLLGL